MENETNTVGFATTCPDHMEVWRKNAARQAADDRFTVLWNELEVAFKANRDECDEGVYNFYLGLLRAYCLLTGDTHEAVHDQLLRAVDREAEGVAIPVEVAVAS